MLERLYRLLFVLPPSTVIQRILAKIRGHRDEVDTPPGAHPFDETHQIDTTGVIRFRDLRSGHAADVYNADYGPSQPSIVRKAIALVPELERSIFVDFGCGKGRALAVASEFPFRDIFGVELVPYLAAKARNNAEEIRRRFPERTPIRIIEGDAAATPLPDGHLVIFMFHPFFKKIMKRVVKNISEFVERSPDNKAYVIYYNPIYWTLFDRSTVFERLFVQEIEYDQTEMDARNFHKDQADAVAIWQTHHVHMSERHPKADATIKLDAAGWRVRITDGPGKS